MLEAGPNEESSGRSKERERVAAAMSVRRTGIPRARFSVVS
jgi:hypothetical protein